MQLPSQAKAFIEKIVANMQLREFQVAPDLSPVNITAFTIAPGAYSPMDCHLEHEYWFIINGNGILICNNVESVLEQGQLYYFAPYTSHQIINASPYTLSILSIYW